jgi:hypothetical protein
MLNLFRYPSKSMLMIIAYTSLLVGCSNQFAASLRKVTYPPEFKYTVKNELRSDMGELAQQVRILDQALYEQHDKTDVNKEQQRQQVLVALQKISNIAAKLEATKSGANHPFMQNYMQDFIAKVDQARVAASLQQPRYYFAGKVSGACTNCHVINR